MILIKKQDIFPIAMGTFGLGAARVESAVGANGLAMNNDAQSDDLMGLRRSFELGQNYIETSSIYAGGETMSFLKTFFASIPRDKIFITVKIEAGAKTPNDIENQIDKYLKFMGLDYADSVLLHTPFVVDFRTYDAYAEMQKLVEKGKSRYISASNLSPAQLKYVVHYVGANLFSFEGLYNLDNKINEDNGIIDYCQKRDILFVAYQPLRRGRIADAGHPVLVNMAKKYNVSQNQILINWMVREKGIVPMIKSANPEHVMGNIDAIGLNISKSDMELLNDFRNAEFDKIVIDWENRGGVPIWKLPNQR